MTMSELSDTQRETARKSLTLILQRLSSVGQNTVAKALSLSEPTLSRMAATQFEQCANAFAVLGVKVVPTHFRCYNPRTFAALQQLALERLQFEDDSTGLARRAGDEDDPE
jgi:hypothetical protein